MRQNEIERSFAIGLMTPKRNRYEASESFDELKSLILTAGSESIYHELVDVRQINPATFIGQGKVDEIKEKIKKQKPHFVALDAELSPVQNRNLEVSWGVKVLDRTGLILDIFAQRAHSKEGKLQVELAQYEYLLPRLVGQWTHLSKQRGGGIGLRGPGETQLEVDRRRVRERIGLLKKNLERVSSSRFLHRQKRQSVPIPTVALIGYTNAGKSTLFNGLVNASVIAEDKLFATLDPKTKKLRLPSGQNVLLSDTVGFIRNLPHQLIQSFKSTFEEVAEADILLHVIDSSHPDRCSQIETVETVLRELDLQDKPIIRVMNKIDCLDLDLFAATSLTPDLGSVKVSGLSGYGLKDLLAKIEGKLSGCYYKRMQLLIPHHHGKAMNELYTHGCVLSTTNTPEGSLVEVHLPPKWQNIFQPYLSEEMALC